MADPKTIEELRKWQEEQLSPHLDKPTTQGALARLANINQLSVDWLTEEMVSHATTPHAILEAYTQMAACNIATIIRSITSTLERNGTTVVLGVPVKDGLATFAVQAYLAKLQYYIETERFVEGAGDERMEEIRAKRKN